MQEFMLSYKRDNSDISIFNSTFNIPDPYIKSIAHMPMSNATNCFVHVVGMSSPFLPPTMLGKSWVGVMLSETGMLFMHDSATPRDSSR